MLAHPLAAPAGDFPFRDDTQPQLGVRFRGRGRTPRVAGLDDVGEARQQPGVGEAPLNVRHHRTPSGGRKRRLSVVCVYGETGGGGRGWGKRERAAQSTLAGATHGHRPAKQQTRHATSLQTPHSTASISSANSEPERGVKRGIHSRAREWWQREQQQQRPTTWLYGPPLPLFYLLLVVFIILLCILSVLMKTDFVQHCMNLILINQISKINK